MNRETEYDLQVRLVDYLLENYPSIIFRSDLGGIRLPPGLANKVKKLSVGSAKSIPHRHGGEPQGKKIAYPDFFIAEPMGGWFGLFIELKRQKSGYCKGKNPLDKQLKNSEHVREQAEILLKLRKKGYYADFVGGWAEIRHLVDWYLGLRETTKVFKPSTWPFSVFNEEGTYDKKGNIILFAKAII